MVLGERDKEASQNIENLYNGKPGAISGNNDCKVQIKGDHKNKEGMVYSA
jgi:hypothetical protein